MLKESVSTSTYQTLSVPNQAERAKSSASPFFIKRVLFATTVFLGAFLLFSVQLLIGKNILPWFGGSAGVWTTCLLFFQMVLLAGYAYAHGNVGRLTPRSQGKLHILLLLISVAGMILTGLFWSTPITPGVSWKPVGGEIALWLILRLLTVSVGLPVLLLATTGPLMQRWFIRVFPGESPYRLYALSNAGSLLGLLSYPVVLEPFLRLHTQAWLWSAGYLVYAVAAIGSAKIAAGAHNNVDASEQPGEANSELETSTPPSYAEKGLWIFLAGLGSLMLLATTRVITQDLAPIPLLWVLPLAVYLITFIVSFDHARWYRPGLFHFLLLAATLGTILCFVYHSGWLKVRIFVGILLIMLFACCIFCHGELYRRRPQPRHLTSFYLMIALGGALGSAFVNLIAPLLFKGYWEMYLGITLCLISMAIMAIRDQASWVHRKNPFIALSLIVWTFWTTELWLNHRSDTFIHYLSDWRSSTLAGLGGISLLLAFRSKENEGKFSIHAPMLTRWCLLLAVTGAGFALTALGMEQYFMSSWAHRNFYGVLYIQEKKAHDPRLNSYALMHGTTYHGVQMITPVLRRYPTSYYTKDSGLGLTLLNFPRQQNAASQGLRVGIIGLGAGTIAAYGQHGDVFRFYEIDPEVIHVASGKYGYFSFLSDSWAQVEIVEGDARISLERELAQQHPQHYDVLVVDAFNSDSVPVHLLTQEAFDLYLKHLRDEDSVIAVHISNRALDLASVLATEAERFHLHVVYVQTTRNSVPEGFIAPSEWVLLSRNTHVLSLPNIAQAGSPIHTRPGLHLWTDDYSNLLQILR